MAHPIWGSLLKSYESEHQKRGTRATHLVAFPLMALAILLAFVKLLAGKSVELCWTGEQGPVYLADPDEPGLRYAVMQIPRD